MRSRLRISDRGKDHLLRFAQPRTLYELEADLSVVTVWSRDGVRDGIRHPFDYPTIVLAGDIPGAAFCVARYLPGKFFLHGLLISIVNSIWITVIHASLFYSYIPNHPEFQQMSDGLPPALVATHGD